MNAPSIWQLGMHFDPSGGGADRCFDDLLKGLEANGRAFTAAAFDGGTVGSGDFRKISLGPSRSPIWKRRAALRGFGEKFSSAPQPKVLATHFSLYAFFLLPFLDGARHVVHFHGPWADESAAAGGKTLAVSVKRWIERAVYARADRLVTLSRAFRILLIEDFGVRPEKISVIPGAVDTEKFRPPGNSAALRRRLGWPLDRRIIFCVRRLTARMGVAELIESFAEIAERFPDVDLHIGGRGPLEGDLRALALRLGLDRRIVFCGYIPEGDLPDHYGASDLTILPSQKLEGFGLAAVESLACGVPVLVTPVGGLPEVVAGISGNLVMEGSGRDAIARGLARSLGEPGFLPSSGECRAYAENHYSISRMARLASDLYDEEASR